MMRILRGFTSNLALCVLAVSFRAGASPVVTNVTAQQEAWPGFLVNIRYDLSDPDGDLATISAAISTNSGARYDVVATNLAGDVGPGIATGTLKHIVWDAGMDMPGFSSATVRVRITADDLLTCGSGVWVSVVGGSWTNPANWQGGVVANGADMRADIATLNITMHRTITLDRPRTIGHVASADIVPSRDWAIDGGMPAGTLTLAVTTGMPEVSVLNQRLVISADVAGTNGILKTGPGTLELIGSNRFSGTAIVSNGTLQLSSENALGNSGLLAVMAGATCDVTGIAFVVPTWQTVCGDGVVAGDMAVSGTIAPGIGVGTLTVSGSAVVGTSATTLMEINPGSVPRADNLRIGGTLVCGGTLMVTNVGIQPVEGESFDLFDGSMSGVFSAIVLPALVPGPHWETGNLYVAGEIVVRCDLGLGVPFINVTNDPGSVLSYDEVAWTALGTNSRHVVGDIWWTNELNGASGAMPVSSFEFQVSGIPLAVGTNVIDVRGTNALGTVASDTVVVTRGPIGTGAPFVDVTNDTVTIANDVATCIVSGTNNPHVAGGMWVSNAANAAVVPFDAADAWTTPAVPVNVGSNDLWIVGTNAWSVATSDRVAVIRGPAGTGVPFLEVTNSPQFVGNDRTPFSVAGTNNGQVIGTMWVSNATVGGTALSFPAAQSWTSAAIGLDVGTNTLDVYGTNAFGIMVSGSVAITRGAVGTGTPLIDITNAALVLAPGTLSFSVAGTNNVQVVGDMWVSNAALGGAAVSFPAAASWIAPTTTVNIGINIIRVYGSNVYGTVGSDSVTLTRAASLWTNEYIVVDVSGGSAAYNYPVTGLDSAPILSDEYRTAKIVLRKVPAGSFRMGAPSNELGSIMFERPQHTVTLSSNYYMGVFEVTQAQYVNVVGGNPSWRTGWMLPVNAVSWDAARGGTWPGGTPGGSTFMGLLRAKTGLLPFDLPTEAQWERACRAGTTNALNNNTNLSDPNNDPNVALLARYAYNSGYAYATVGSYLPNNWGLYDMHGNAWEWCLDASSMYTGDVTDPPGAGNTDFRMYRGGSFSSNAAYCRSAYRLPFYIAFDDEPDAFGFRLACPAGP